MKKILLHIICLVVLVIQPIHHAQSQDRYIDSLNHLLKIEADASSQYRLTIQKIEHLRYIDTDKALEACFLLGEKSGLKLSTIQKHELEFQQGMIYFTKGDYVNCIKIANTILKQSEHPYGKAVAYYLFGIINDQEKKREKALEDYEKCLELLKNNDQPSLKAELYNSLGNNYFYTKNHDKAIYYFNQAIQLNKSLKSTINLGFNLNNLANVYIALFKFKEAEANYTELLTLATKEDNQLGIALAYLNLGILQSKQKKYSAAETNLTNGLPAAKKVKVKDLIRVYYAELSNINRSMGKHEKALDYYILSTAYADSLSQENTLKALAETEGMLKKKEDSLTIQKLENTSLEQKAKEERFIQESRRKTIFLASAVVVLLLMAVLIFVVIRNNSRRKKLNADLAREKQLVEHKNTEILDSINYAKRIQTAILPPAKIIRESLPNSFVLYKPKDIVAGDFYWLEKKGDIVLLAACDCTGHGVPGAMVSVICNNGLNRSVREYNLTEPGKILDKTREIVIQEFEKSEEEVKDGMDVSLLAFYPKAVKWSAANNPLWIIRNGTLIEYKANKQPIGKYAEPKPFTTHEIDVHSGDSLYIFTDGLQDQFGGEKGKKFKASKLKELLLSIQQKTMQEQMHIIEEAFEKWKGNLEQNDDVCLIGVKL